MKHENSETKLIRELNLTVKKLHKERDDFPFSRREITWQWMDVLEDVRKEYEREVEKLKETVAALLDMIVSLKNQNFHRAGCYRIPHGAVCP